MNDRPALPVGAIAVTTEEILMLLGRLYLENYTLQKRVTELTRPVAPPPAPAPEAPDADTKP